MNYRKRVENFVEDLMDYMYPLRMGKSQEVLVTKQGLLESVCDMLNHNLKEAEPSNDAICKLFFESIGAIKSSLNKDIEAIYQGDPAAVDYAEVIIAYPGFNAIAIYRIAHRFLQLGVPLIPRIMTEYAHHLTGVDIHPGASIGEYFCIDHGTGVVIGQTAVIGNHVKIYQGVTLGALSINKKNIEGQRHPTIEDKVVIYAQATILGGKTVIGSNTIIGGNVWITKSVAPNSKIYYKVTEDQQISSKKNNMKKIVG